MNTLRFSLVAGSDDATVRTSPIGDPDRSVAQARIGLLLGGGKGAIEIQPHDLWQGGVDLRAHRLAPSINDSRVQRRVVVSNSRE